MTGIYFHCRFLIVHSVLIPVDLRRRWVLEEKLSILQEKIHCAAA